jgi:aminopeptidase
MADLRTATLADLLINYSLGLQPGQTVAIMGSTAAAPLIKELYRYALRAGAHPYALPAIADLQEIFLREGNEAQWAHLSPISELIVAQFDAMIQLIAPENTRALAGIDPARMATLNAAQAPLQGRRIARLADPRFHDVISLFPTPALAQEADMSLSDYEDFVYAACRVDEPDPKAAWQAQGAEQQRIVDWLKGKRTLHLQGPNCDLRLGIAGRDFINAQGHVNFPDGEVFTSPEETLTEGYIRFTYPAIYPGREVTDVELRFHEGRVVEATATKGREFLDRMLGVDEGARRLGEIAVGTNPGIRRYTKNILLDEKISGTIHCALGNGFSEVGGQNRSAIHWDMVNDMTQGTITVDDTVVYRDGRFVI